MKVVYLLCGLLCDNAVWRHQAQALAADYDVRVVNFVGFDSLSEMAASVLSQAPQTFALAGHSMGGRVALEVLRQDRQRVERLALLDTGFAGVVSGEAAQRAVLVDQAMAEGIHAIAEAWMLPMLAPEHRSDAALTREILDMVCRMSGPIYAGHTRALLTRLDASDVLSSIRCPTLILCGQEDSWSAPAQHRAMAALVPGSALKLIDHCGHMAMLEQPELITTALREWLAA